MAPIPRPKIRTSDYTPSSVPILLLVPKSLLHGIPITATAQDLHHAQYLEHHKIPHEANDSPPPIQKKTSTLHHIAILVPPDELIMNTCMQVWQAIFETHYHNINDIKNQDYWLLTSNVGIKIQKALHCSTGPNNTFWPLPVCRTVSSANHNLLYTIKFHLMATFWLKDFN